MLHLFRRIRARRAIAALTVCSAAYRITQVVGPLDSMSNPVYTVTYEYNSDFNLSKVNQDPLKPPFPGTAQQQELLT